MTEGCWAASAVVSYCVREAASVTCCVWGLQGNTALLLHLAHYLLLYCLSPSTVLFNVECPALWGSFKAALAASGANGV